MNLERSQEMNTRGRRERWRSERGVSRDPLQAGSLEHQAGSSGDGSCGVGRAQAEAVSWRKLRSHQKLKQKLPPSVCGLDHSGPGSALDPGPGLVSAGSPPEDATRSSAPGSCLAGVGVTLQRGAGGTVPDGLPTFSPAVQKSQITAGSLGTWKRKSSADRIQCDASLPVGWSGQGRRERC